METRKMKLALSAGAIALSLALAGCGGGGSAGGPTPAQVAAQEAMKRAEMQAEAIDTALDAARMAIGGIDAENPTQDQVTAAENAVEALDMAVKAAADVDADTVAGHAATVMDLNDSVTLAQSAVDAGTSVAEAQAERDAEKAAKEKAEGKLSEMEKKEAIANAKKLFAGLNRQFDGDSTNDFDVAPDTVASETNAGSAFTIANGKASVSSGNNAALGKAEGKMLDAVDGWAVTQVMATDPAAPKNTDTVMVYSNREAPTSEAWTATIAGGFSLTANDDGRYAPSALAGWLSEAGDGRVGASAFPNAGNAPTAHGNKDKTDETLTVRGTYAGASGGYVCIEQSGNTCTYQKGSGGIKLTGGWTFDPDDGAMAMIADPSYSYFGWWLRETSGGDYLADTFHSGAQSPIWDTDKYNALTGKEAKYEGPAAGKYALNGFPGEDASGGHFTATAKLTANFQENADGTSGGTNSSISGMIDGFMAGGESKNWKVTLMPADINPADGQATGTPMARWEIGSHKGPNGEYSAAFREQGADGSPNTLTGAWEVSYGNTHGSAIGHMIGAFGATKQ